MSPLDASTRDPRDGAPSFSLTNRLIRLVWIICWLMLAAWTPRQAAPWRRLLLRAFGARMAPGADVRGSARVWLPANLTMGDNAVIGPGVDCYNQERITIGPGALVSQRACLCAGSHDVNDLHFQLIARPITIGARSWVAAEAFVGPGTQIGEGAVLGARGVAFGRLDQWTIYAGNPATALRPRRINAVGDDHMAQVPR